MGHLWVKKDEIESDMKSAQKKENDVKKKTCTKLLALMCLTKHDQVHKTNSHTLRDIQTM